MDNAEGRGQNGRAGRRKVREKERDRMVDKKNKISIPASFLLTISLKCEEIRSNKKLVLFGRYMYYPCL